jgi:hypothetical protein
MSRNVQVGQVLTDRNPQPPDGTPLLGPDGRVERYDHAEIGGQWRRYAKQLGPFVVAPDYDAAVEAAGLRPVPGSREED